nr:hypothetical protein CDS [Bradyrhizobium sp.]
MKYQPEFLSADEERALLADIETLPFKELNSAGSPASAVPFLLAGATISMAVVSPELMTCLNS